MNKPYDRPQLILASKSPRRSDLLKQAGLTFSIIPSDFDEKSVMMSDPESYVRILAKSKATDISKKHPDSWVLGADTIVLIDDRILGKPGSKDEARSMLKQLSGKTHQVITGYCLCCQTSNDIISEAVRTDVRFKTLSDSEIEWYIQTGEPFDKAGAYAIQGIGTLLVKSINGSYTNVVGLPVCEVIESLINRGIMELNMELKQQLEQVRERIRQACESCNRNADSVRLVAVSKTIAAGTVKEAIEAGVTILGENYVQEAREKFNALLQYPVSWHFIGHLQSNKAKYAVRLFDLIHSVDSLKLARELNKQAEKVDKIQQILVQVNISAEDTKAGTSADEAPGLISEISQMENLSIKGLMTMPPYFYQPEKVKPFFAALRELRDQIKAQSPPNVSLEELSMGMTGDFEVAIEEGATLVRIGTAIFGER